MLGRLTYADLSLNINRDVVYANLVHRMMIGYRIILDCPVLQVLTTFQHLFSTSHHFSSPLARRILRLSSTC